MSNLVGRDYRPHSHPSRTPGPIPLAYGVEIEATVVITRGDPAPGLEPGLPPPIQIPPSCKGTAETFEHIKDVVQRVLERHDLPTETVAVNMNEPPPSRETLGAYSFFHGTDDWSVDTPGRYLASLEISTPAFPDAGDSYEVLRYTINILTSSFLMTVNPTCGLHVHVGQADGFTYDALRRIGSLLWAVDPLLLMLNPPWRALSAYCPSIRDCSRVARGVEAKDLPAHDEACRCLRRCIRPGERSQAWREAHPKAMAPFLRTRAPGHFEPYHDAPGEADHQIPYDFGSHRPGKASPTASSAAASSHAGDAPDPRRNTATQRQIAQRTAPLPRRVHAARRRLVPLPRLRRTRHSYVQLSAWARRLRPLVTMHDEPPSPSADLGVYAGVRRLYEAETSCAISALMTDTATSRMNIHLGPSYRCGRARRPGAPRTVEFRGAEGCLDPAWVGCWTRICLGLVRFAMNAPVPAFLAVLKCCCEADIGAPYDIIDLLCHIGLLAEAHIAAKRLRENAGLWGLEFVEEPAQAD